MYINNDWIEEIERFEQIGPMFSVIVNKLKGQLEEKLNQRMNSMYAEMDWQNQQLKKAMYQLLCELSYIPEITEEEFLLLLEEKQRSL